jgi:hypothetical protein
LAYGEDQFEEGFMAKVWDKGLRVGSPGIYIPLGIKMALIRESIENEFAMAVSALRQILYEMHLDLEISIGALALSEEGNINADFCYIVSGGDHGETTNGQTILELEAIQSNKSPMPLPTGKSFRWRFLSQIKELVDHMGKKELQVRLIHDDVIDRLNHGMGLEDKKSRDKMEACSSGWLQLFSPLLMLDTTKPGWLKRRQVGSGVNKDTASMPRRKVRMFCTPWVHPWTHLVELEC